MVFVICCAVYLKSADKLLSEWKITQLGHQSTTFREFFNSSVTSFIGSNNQLQLQAAYIGSGKVDQNPVFLLNMQMYKAMVVFSRYMKKLWNDEPYSLIIATKIPASSIA